MKKKLIMCSSIYIFILGVCLSLFVNKTMIDNNEKESLPVAADSAVETEIEAAEAGTTEAETTEAEYKEEENLLRSGEMDRGRRVGRKCGKGNIR